MRNILIVIIVLLPFSLKGQEVIDSIIKSDKNQISVGLIFSPDYCFRTLNNNDGSSSSAMIIDLRNEMEEPVFGFTAGLNFFYGITKKVGIESGVHYSRQGFQLKQNDLFFGDPIDPREMAKFTNPLVLKLLQVLSILTITIISKFLYEPYSHLVKRGFGLVRVEE